MNIYVGNLSAGVTGDELRQEFMAFGEVTSVTIVDGKYIGDFRRHGFVEMTSLSEGGTAIAALNRAILRDRKMDVIQALPLSHKTGTAPYDGSYGDKPRHWFGSRARPELRHSAGQYPDS